MSTTFGAFGGDEEEGFKKKYRREFLFGKSVILTIDKEGD